MAAMEPPEGPLDEPDEVTWGRQLLRLSKNTKISFPTSRSTHHTR